MQQALAIALHLASCAVEVVTRSVALVAIVNVARRVPHDLHRDRLGDAGAGCVGDEGAPEGVRVEEPDLPTARAVLLEVQPRLDQLALEDPQNRVRPQGLSSRSSE